MNNDPYQPQNTPQSTPPLNEVQDGVARSAPSHGMSLQPLNEAEVLRERALADEAIASQAAPVEPLPISGQTSYAEQPVVQDDSGVSAASAQLPLVNNQPAEGEVEARARFPWVRTLLVGLVAPLLLFGTIVGVVALVTKTKLFISLPQILYILPAVPYVLGLVVAVFAAMALSKLRVRYPLFIALGVIIFSAGAWVLLSTLSLTPLGLQWGWGGENGYREVTRTILYVLMPFIGVIAITLLVLPTNILRNKLPNVLCIVIALGFALLPFGANYIAEQTRPSLEEVMTGAYSRQGNDTKLHDAKNESGEWPILPVTAYAQYNKQKVEGCIQSGFVVSGVKHCDLSCAEKIDGVCVDVSLKSGRLYDEHGPYLYKNGKCDASNIGYVMNNMQSGDKLPSVKLVSCRVLKTPEGRTVYGEDQSGRSLSNFALVKYYVTEKDAIAELGIYMYNAPNAPVELSAAMVQRAETHLLEFIDTFEIVDRK